MQARCLRQSQLRVSCWHKAPLQLREEVNLVCTYSVPVAILKVHMSSLGPPVLLLTFSFSPYFSLSQFFRRQNSYSMLLLISRAPCVCRLNPASETIRKQTRWESLGTTQSSKTTPLPAGNTHLEPCYSHTAWFQSYFPSASCAHVAHLDPSASIIPMSDLLASQSVKPLSQAENHNLCYSNCAPFLLFPSLSTFHAVPQALLTPIIYPNNELNH